MKGSGHGGAGSSRVDWIEVYGRSVRELVLLASRPKLVTKLN